MNNLTPQDGAYLIKRLDSSDVDRWAGSISALLKKSALLMSDRHRGHLPDEIVRRIVVPRYTSEEAVLFFKEWAWRFICIDSSNCLLGTILVAKEPNVVVGFSSTQRVREIRFGDDGLGIHVPRGHFSIFNFAVDPQYRRRGIGRRLVNEVLKDHPMKEAGCGLWSRTEPPMKKCFLDLGFIHIPQMDAFFSRSDSKFLPTWAQSVEDFNKSYVAPGVLDRYHGMDIVSRKLKYFCHVLPFD